MSTNRRASTRQIWHRLILIAFIAFILVSGANVSYAEQPTSPDVNGIPAETPAEPPAEIGIAKIMLEKTELTLQAGAVEQIHYSVAPPTADDKKLVWTSSDETVAEVDGTGIVTATGAGTATITAASPDGKTSSSAIIRVYGFRVSTPETVGAGQYVPIPVSYTMPVEQDSGVVSYTVEKVSGEGSVFFSAVDMNGSPVNFLNNGSYMPEGFTIPSGQTDAVDWTVKFSETGDYTLKFTMKDAGGNALGSVLKNVTVTPFVMNLGRQVFQDGILRGTFGVENGKAVGYTVITSKPDSRFVVIDMETEKVIKQFDLPDAEGAWGIHVAGDGRVYIGTYVNAKIFRYDPEADRVEDLKGPLQSVPGSLFYEMAEDRDGMIYVGSYPDNKVFRLHPGTGEFTDLGPMVDGQFYARTIVYEKEQHAIYVGAGGNRASLIKYDLATGTKTEMLPESIRDRYKLTYDLTLANGKLFIKLDPNFGLVVMDMKTGAVIKDFGNLAIHSRGTSELSPYANKVYLTYGGILKEYDLNTDTITNLSTPAGVVDFKANAIGLKMVELHDPDFPGYTLVGFAGNTGGKMFKYNLQSGALKVFTIDLPKVALKLHTLGAGPDGKIYSGAFLPGGMGIYNPADGSSVSNGFRQVEGMTSLGGKMYFGVYPGSIIFEYDTTKAWKSSGSGQTVVSKFELKGYDQDRPYAMLGVPELRKIFIGTVPGYALSGGALTVYDPAVTPVKYDVYRNVVQDQSIITLAYKDGKIYGGTSHRGGLGADWPYADGKLFVFDPATGQKEYETVPVPGKGAVNKLIAGPDGNIWGFANGTFFVYSPAERKVIHSVDAFPEANAGWRDAEMDVSVRDGHVYGTVAGDNFFRIDKDTKEIKVLLKGASGLTQDRMGNFYFKLKDDEASLFRYTVEDNTFAVNGIRLNKQQLTLSVGEKETLTAAIYPQFASRKSVTWTTSNSAVADVSAAGAVSALSQGTATITVTSADGQYSAAAVVTVQ